VFGSRVAGKGNVGCRSYLSVSPGVAVCRCVLQCVAECCTPTRTHQHKHSTCTHMKASCLEGLYACMYMAWYMYEHTMCCVSERERVRERERDRQTESESKRQRWGTNTRHQRHYRHKHSRFVSSNKLPCRVLHTCTYMFATLHIMRILLHNTQYTKHTHTYTHTVIRICFLQ